MPKNNQKQWSHRHPSNWSLTVVNRWCKYSSQCCKCVFSWSLFIKTMWYSFTLYTVWTQFQWIRGQNVQQNMGGPQEASHIATVLPQGTARMMDPSGVHHSLSNFGGMCLIKQLLSFSTSIQPLEARSPRVLALLSWNKCTKDTGNHGLLIQ